MKHLFPNLFRFRRSTAWIALCAMLLWSLMPAGGGRAAQAAPGELIEVCTMAGMVLMPAPTGGADGTPAPAAERSDCPWCCPHAGGFALLPAGASLPAAQTAMRALLAPQSAAPVRPLRWRLSFARAPPVLS